jgi:hypothetical protein
MAQDTNALINTVAASAGDISYSNGNLTIAVDNGTFPTMFVPNIKTFTKTTGVAETSQTSTVTFTAANSTLYELAISQEVGAPNGAPATFIASYTSDSTATEQEIVDAFIDLINSQTGDTGIQVTATDGGASTITLTAQTGFPFFTASAITNMTVAAGVTGIAEQGIGATLAAEGISGAVSGTTYTTYIFEYFSSAAAQMGAELNAGLNTLTLYVNQGDADFAWFNAQLNLIVAPNSADKYAQKISHATAAINATATASAAEVATGWITSTSGAATTITLPTGTLLGGELGADRGDVFDLYVDNSAGGNTVTIAVAVDGVLSSAAADTAGSFGDLTIANGATGVGRYTLMFSSATTYTFTRTA